MSARSSAPDALSALSAVSITTRPPFISSVPGPEAQLPVFFSESASPDVSGSRLVPCMVKCWKGLSFSNTVSICPMSSTRLPHFPGSGHGCSAIRVPARCTSSIGTQPTLKPSDSNCDFRTFPTARTPSRFLVPLLISTSWRNRSTGCCFSASIAWRIFVSVGLRF